MTVSAQHTPTERDTTSSVRVRAPGLARIERSCSVCGATYTHRDRAVVTCEAHRWSRQGAAVDRTTPYARDMAARLFVRQHQDGASYRAIGEQLGITRQAVHCIVQRALPRLIDGLLAAGFDAEDVAALVARANGEGSSGLAGPGREAFAPMRVGEPDVPEDQRSETERRIEDLLASIEASVDRINFVIERAEHVAPEAA